ncbi:hypothetical protein [Streptomyces sp. HSG2]|uniref:SCO2583/SCO2584 N-terminal domain-containing protein n=1 Tax=Streptomyces sp. HSG2 TaxID=2797167 RepID=UPI00190736CE|nr:hypothetical protein [Streptomyces sp. HSG2]
MPEPEDDEREFDLRWAEGAPYKEPSARARMLAARWKDDPPGPVPFRPEPDGRSRRARSGPGPRPRLRRRFRFRLSGGRRSPWLSVTLVFASLVAVILVLGYLG